MTFGTRHAHGLSSESQFSNLVKIAANFKPAYLDKQQLVQFDSALLGTRPWAIMKLDRVGEEVGDSNAS